MTQGREESSTIGTRTPESVLEGGAPPSSEPARHSVTGARAVLRSVAGRYRVLRRRLGGNPVADLVFRVVIGVVGTAVVILGVIALPAPGPGWAIIFVGLGILATEFDWAYRLLRWVRRRYDEWTAWLGRQRRPVQLLVAGGILMLIVGCAWCVGAFGVVASWFGIDWSWLRSPFTLL